MIFKNVGEIRK